MCVRAYIAVVEVAYEVFLHLCAAAVAIFVLLWNDAYGRKPDDSMFRMIHELSRGECKVNEFACEKRVGWFGASSQHDMAASLRRIYSSSRVAKEVYHSVYSNFYL